MSLLPYVKLQDCGFMTSIPGWETIKCWHCNGHGVVAHWDVPDECDTCSGSGYVWKHLKSKVFAKCPGGPFLGKENNPFKG